MVALGPLLLRGSRQGKHEPAFSIGKYCALVLRVLFCTFAYERTCERATCGVCRLCAISIIPVVPFCGLRLPVGGGGLRLQAAAAGAGGGGSMKLPQNYVPGAWP